MMYVLNKKNCCGCCIFSFLPPPARASKTRRARDNENGVLKTRTKFVFIYMNLSLFYMLINES